jgi:hypothetical protein
MQRRREERERMKSTAGLLTRAKWWVTGMPDLDPDGVDRDERATAGDRSEAASNSDT